MIPHLEVADEADARLDNLQLANEAGAQLGRRGRLCLGVGGGGSGQLVTKGGRPTRRRRLEWGGTAGAGRGRPVRGGGSRMPETGTYDKTTVPDLSKRISRGKIRQKRGFLE